MDKQEVKEILCQQLNRLAEKSKEVKSGERGAVGSLVDISNAMCRLTDSYKSLLENLDED